MLGVNDVHQRIPITVAQPSHEILRDYIYVVSIGKVYLFWYNLHELANNIYEVVTAVKDSWTVLAVDNSAVVVDEDHINAGSRFAFKMREKKFFNF